MTSVHDQKSELQHDAGKRARARKPGSFDGYLSTLHDLSYLVLLNSVFSKEAFTSQPLGEYILPPAARAIPKSTSMVLGSRPSALGRQI